MKKVVYVATPYNALLSADGDDSMAVATAVGACDRVLSFGYTPLSPVIAFRFVFNEGDREKVLEAGLDLLAKCDYIYAPLVSDELSWGQGLA